MEPYVVNIEADIQSGLPAFHMVGMLASEVREAQERVRSALKNIGRSLPIGRITINISPADKRKEGTGFDLPVAIALLCCMGVLNVDAFKNTLIIGELSLDGGINPIRGVLPIVHFSGKHGIKRVIIPYDNIDEGFLCEDIEVLPFHNLTEILLFYQDKEFHENQIDMMRELKRIFQQELGQTDRVVESDFSEIIGQESVKQAIIIAVAGNHDLLMVGAPGVGKSMLASRIPDIMPDMSREESMEVTSIASITGMLDEHILKFKRPYIAPHHTVTTPALIGGGIIPQAGLITKAHLGILFMDELPEFKTNVIDSLRQPLEDKYIRIHRQQGDYTFPADFMLVGAMNPCPCGYYPDRNRCSCSVTDVKKYMASISGPILDRIDICVEVPRIEMTQMQIHSSGNHLSSREMRRMVNRGIKMQQSRQGYLRNANLGVQEMKEFCKLDHEGSELLENAYEKFQMSMRGYHKILKIARTIADINEREQIEAGDIAQALAYRMDVKKYR